MGQIFTVRLVCRHDEAGDIWVDACECHDAKVSHRIIPERPLLLKDFSDLEAHVRDPAAYSPGVKGVMRHKGATLFAGIWVHSLTWMEGAKPSIRFKTDMSELGVFLALHFGQMGLPEDHVDEIARDIYGGIIIPTMNVSTALTSGAAVSPDMQNNVHGLLAKIELTRSVLETAVEMRLPLPQNACSPIGLQLAPVANRRGPPMIGNVTRLHLTQEAPDTDYRIHSIETCRGRARHRQFFAQPEALPETLGPSLGDLLSGQLSSLTQDVNAMACKDLIFRDESFEFKGAHFNSAVSETASFHRAASVFLYASRGTPAQLQKVSPWCVDHPISLYPRAQSTVEQILIVLDAARDVLTSSNSSDVRLLNGEWMHFKQGHLWFLANLLGERLPFLTRRS